MRRSTLNVLALGALCAAVLSACAPADERIAATGTIVSDDIALLAPAIPEPSPRVTAAFDEQPATSTNRDGSAPTAVTAAGSAIRARVASAPVAPGDRVSANQVVAVFDTGLLDANLVATAADITRAQANLRLLDERIRDTGDARTELAEKRADLAATIAELEATRARLVSQRDAAADALARVEAMLRGGPAGPPPGSQPPSMPPGTPLPPGVPNPEELRAGITKLTAGIARIDAGLAQARAGLRRIDSARESVTSARETLRSMRPVVEAAVGLSEAALGTAKAQLELATVRAPVDGVVVVAPLAGDVLAPGAPVATIRPLAPVRVRTWVTVDELERVSAGDEATVRIDSRPGTDFDATVTRIGTSTGFPPTSLSTQELHLIRAVPIEVTLTSTEPLPPGTPADLLIDPR